MTTPIEHYKQGLSYYGQQKNEEAAAELQADARRRLPAAVVSIGIGRVVEDPLRLRDSHAEARQARAPWLSSIPTKSRVLSRGFLRASDKRMAASRSDPKVADCETGSSVFAPSGWFVSARMSITFKLCTILAIIPTLAAPVAFNCSRQSSHTVCV